MPGPIVMSLPDVLQIAVAGFACWLAWETRGLRRNTFSLLVETRRSARLSLAPYLFLEVERDPETRRYSLGVVNESNALAVQVDCFIYDSANRHFLQFMQLTHSKPGDDDEPELIATVASREEAIARVLRRNPGVAETAVAGITDCGTRSAAIAFYQDAEQRLYATRRIFTEEVGMKISHVKQQRVLLCGAVNGDEGG